MTNYDDEGRNDNIYGDEDYFEAVERANHELAWDNPWSEVYDENDEN